MLKVTFILNKELKEKIKEKGKGDLQTIPLNKVMCCQA